MWGGLLLALAVAAIWLWRSGPDPNRLAGALEIATREAEDRRMNYGLDAVAVPFVPRAMPIADRARVLVDAGFSCVVDLPGSQLTCVRYAQGGPVADCSSRWHYDTRPEAVRRAGTPDLAYLNISC